LTAIFFGNYGVRLANDKNDNKVVTIMIFDSFVS